MTRRQMPESRAGRFLGASTKSLSIPVRFALAAASFLRRSPRSCSWTSAATVSVTFGDGASCVPYDYGSNETTLNTATLSGGVVKSAGNRTLFAASQTVVLSRPTSPVTPALSVTSPDTVGVCDGLSLDASGAVGGGGRSLAYSWTLIDGPDASGRLGALLSAAAGSPRVSLAWDDLDAGNDYVFAVEAENYLGESGVALASAYKSAAPTPVVQFQRSDTSVVRSDAVTLKLDVELPSTTGPDSRALRFLPSMGRDLSRESWSDRACQDARLRRTAGDRRSGAPSEDEGHRFSKSERPREALERRSRETL